MGEAPVYEELYDLHDDPHEMRNLAPEPRHREILAAMRRRCAELLRDAKGSPQMPDTVVSPLPGEAALTYRRLAEIW